MATTTRRPRTVGTSTPWRAADRSSARSRRFSWRRRAAVAGGDETPLVAHILRRLTFGPHPWQLDEYAALGATGTIEQLLAAGPLDPERPQLGTDDDYGLMIRWWSDLLARPDAGLHEKIVWFWHGHLTSSLDKAEAGMMLRQHEVLREHALGNFRSLLQAITLDGAMLEWLDGAWSTSEAPNENYARELMELFALGRGNYSEQDIRNAAYALTGYGIDYDNDHEIYFDDAAGPQETRTVLGAEVRSAEDVVNVVCDQPACAAFITVRLYEFLVGDAPDDVVRDQLAAAFRDSGLEIRVLVEGIVRHPSFLDRRLNRHRPPVEWFTHARAFLGTGMDHWVLDGLGQVPFNPPNVRGWPGGERWQSAGSNFAKAQAAWDNSWDTEAAEHEDPVGSLLWKAGLVEVSEETWAALSEASESVNGLRERSTLLHALIVCSPEFSVA